MLIMTNLVDAARGMQVNVEIDVGAAEPADIDDAALPRPPWRFPRWRSGRKPCEPSGLAHTHTHTPRTVTDYWRVAM